MKKLPRRLSKSLAAFECLFLAISVKHLWNEVKVHPFLTPVK
jgi:hypothetical protein